MRRVLSLSLVRFIVTALLAAGLTSVALAQNSHTRTFFVPQARVTQPISESNLATLKGNTIYLADAKHDRGPVDPNTPTGHIIMLLQRAPEQEAALGALMDNQQDPKSPNYHNWLTAEEFGKNFGPVDSDVDKVTGWLKSKGFNVEEVTPGRTFIIFSGTVGQVQEAFHTQIHYLSVKGEQHQSNMSDPMVPAALAPVIGGFHRLNDFRPKPLMAKAGVRKVDPATGRFTTVPGVKNPGPAPAITYSYSGYTDWDVTPQDWYTIYNANSALGAGITGAGVTIAVIEETGLHANTTAGYGDVDIRSFRSAFGLPAYPTSGGANGTQGGINYYNGTVPGATACTAAATPTNTDEEGEALLDTEWAGAAAPNAIVDYVACATSGSGGIGAAGTDISGETIVNYLYSTVVSTSLSYGECEVAAGSSGAAFYTHLWQQGSAEGITHVISTGDAGANQCDQDEYVGYYATADNALSVNAMSSSVYNIAAGGTDFSDVYQVKGGTPSTYWNTANSSTFESALSYIPEVSWGAYCANPLFASELQANATTVFGTTYTPIAICNNSNTISDGLYAATGGGGGVSAYNAIPTWQSVYNGTGNQGNVSTTLRNTPDVAMFASSGWWSHALVYCQSDTGGSCVYTVPNDFAGIMVAGGTSFVAPPVNGIMGLINQKYGRQGNANYTLYKLAAAEYGTTGSPSAGIASCSGSHLGPGVSSSCIFNDVANDTPCLSGTTECGTSTSGTSGSGALTSTEIGSDIANFCIRSSTNPCWRSASQSYGITSTGGTHPTTFNDAYRTAQGYDLATGLGSINITNLVNGWNTVSSTFTSTTAIAANPTSITSSGGSTTLTGTVTATQRKGVPAGTVTFYIGSTGGTNLGSAPLTTSCTGLANPPNGSAACVGVATLSVAGTQLNSGSNSIIAYFPGDGANDGPSTSTATTVTYTPTVSTTTAVSSSANPSTYGQSVSFTATVTGNSPTGTVQFVVDSANFGSPVTLSGGSATSGSISTLATGTHTVTATYSGDSGNNGSTGTLAGGQVVSQAGQTITFTTPAPASAEYNSSFTVAATGGASGNAIVFTSAGSCTNSGATYTMTSGTGNCSVIADQAGNAYYSAAPEVTETTAAADSNGSVSVGSSLNPSTYGTAVTFTATITSDTGAVKGRKGSAGKKPLNVTGSVTWSANTGCSPSTVTGGYPGTATCTTSSLAVGSDTVTANYGGDSNHNAGSGSVIQTVSQVSTTTAVASSLNPSEYGQAVSFSATVTGASPTGTVQFYINGSPFDTETLASGTATSVSTSALTAGTYTVTATYSGDTNNTGSSGTLAGGQVVNGSNSTTAVTSTPNPSTYATSVTFTATITTDTGDVKGRKPARKNGMNPMQPTGTVTWSANTGCAASTLSGSYPGVATCTTSSASHLPVGTDVVTASYSGDSNHTASSGSVNQVVTGGIATTIDVTSVSPASEEFGADTPVTITAVLAWTGHGVAPTASDVTIGGNGNGTYGATSCAARVHETITCTATYTPTTADVAGSYTETATFSGDTNYTASSSPESNNFAITGSNSTTTVTSTPNPSTYATSVTFTATITSDTGDVKGRKAGKKGMNPMQPTGTVTWSANTGCAPSTLTGSYPGVATCTTSSASHLPVGTDVVTATYSGDSNHSGSSGSVNQVVTGGIATTIDVTSVSPASEEFAADTPATITAVLSWTGHGVAPTAANVTIGGNGNGTYGATSCAARVHETITCTAIYTPTSADVAGVYTETATFSGDTNYAASSSPETNNFSIGSNASTTSVSSGLNPSTYGGSVTFTATITSDTGDVKGRKPAKKNGMQPMQPTGTVTWSANTGCSASTLTGSYPGVATCTTSSLGGGSNTVSATYSGDSNHAGSSGSVSQTVNPASQTITFTTTAPSSEPYNGTFGVAASASSSLTVAFTAAGNCSVADNHNGTATYTITSGAGTCTVKANQAGNSNYSAAAQATESVSATPASQTINVTTPAPATATKSSSFTVVASATSGLPITWGSAGICTNVQGTYTMTGSSGTCTVLMNAPSSTNYTAAPQVTETVRGALAIAPTVSLTGPATAPYQSTYTVVATTNASTTPTFTAAPATVCTISGATVTMVNGTGMCTVTAHWAADDVYKAATATEKTTATKVASVVTWNTPATITYGTALSATQLDATASVPGAFVYDPASGKVLGAGTQTLSVKFTPTATSDYTTVAATTVSLVVNQANTTTAITSTSLNPSIVGHSITVHYNVASPGKATGSVTITASSGETCTGTVSGTTGDGSCIIKPETVGSITLTGTYGGDANNNGSTSAGFTQTVNN